MNLQSLVKNIVYNYNNHKEHFDSNGNVIKPGQSVLVFIIGFLLIALVVLLIHLLISKPLWNHCLVRLVSVKKCESVWHIIGTSILLGLLLPSSFSYNIPK